MIHSPTSSVLPNGPTYNGVDLSHIPGALRPLRASTELAGDGEALRGRMAEEGYLFLPGLLNTERVLEARRAMVQALEAEGMLDPDFPPLDAVAKPGIDLAFRGDLATGNPAVERLLYEGELMTFWETFFGREVLHFDYTWLRAKAPAEKTVTPPHCDTVFMNRGTDQLYTAWTPLGSVSYEEGGLMVLEKSHGKEDILGEYWKMDVDEYCTNGPEAAAIESGEISWQADRSNGMFHEDAVAVQENVGGTWLTTEYQPGDVLVFGMHTLHAAADNQSRKIRLSTDSRYQPVGEPVDERWVGANPIGHGPNAKKGMIC